MQSDLNILRQACAGLLYPSESDQPIEVHELEGPQGSAREVLAPFCDRLEEVPWAKFFDDFQDGDRSNERISALRELLQTHLIDLHVFRGSGVEIPIYITGRTRAGRWICLQTLAVET